MVSWEASGLLHLHSWQALNLASLVISDVFGSTQNCAQLGQFQELEGPIGIILKLRNKPFDPNDALMK